MISQFLSGLGFLICILLNILISRIGYSNILSGDKDIFLPFSAMTFLFFPLLIYLPEAHYKLTIYGSSTNISAHEEAEEEEQKFPYAFLITLLAITASVMMHRLWLFNRGESEQEKEYRKNIQVQKSNSSVEVRNRFRNMEYRVESLILKYYLSLGIGLENIVSAFYITIEHESMNIIREFIIFSAFSLLINFSYGYINGWSTVSKELHYRLTYFVNVGIVLGYILGLMVGNNPILLILPCLCCGVMIYSSTLVCLPALFSHGEDQTQDKFRYGAIFTSLLSTVVYHPVCYLLRV